MINITGETKVNAATTVETGLTDIVNIFPLAVEIIQLFLILLVDARLIQRYLNKSSILSLIARILNSTKILEAVCSSTV